MTAASAWGRIDDQGTVWVKTPDGGEREVGSWQAGDPEAGMALFTRRYADLDAEIELLLQRVKRGAFPAEQAPPRVEELRTRVAEAHVVGDLGLLVRKLDAVMSASQEQATKGAEQRAKAREETLAAKEALVVEAETLAQSSEWRVAGETLRGLVERWKGMRRVDRTAEQELWKRLSAARDTFAKRRKAHFAELDERHGQAKAEKERIAAEAEALSASTDWGATAGRYRDLMTAWKAAGHAGKPDDDRLWARFRTAQDTFFTARNSQLAARDAEYSANLTVKEAVVADAERLLPVSDPRAARAALREIHERWEAAGRVPRQSMAALDARMRKVEDEVRAAEEAKLARTNPEVRARAEATAAQLRPAVAKLEKQLTAAGDNANRDRLQAELEAKRAWLDQAEQVLADFEV